MKQSTCKRKKCFQDKQKGDLLFCSNCGDDWIEFCKYNDIHEKQVPINLTNKLLEQFINS